jgi:hypothetical protein
MRLALVLLLVVGCAKKSGESTPKDEPAGVGAATPPAAEPPKAPESQAVTTTAPGNAQDKAAPPSGGGAASGSAIDQARASGVLGPTDQHAFAVSGKVTIKSASTKPLDAAAKTNLDAIKACYDKALEFKDTLAGQLTVSVKDGKPTIAKSTLNNPELEQCVVEALAALPKSGKATLVLAFKRE